MADRILWRASLDDGKAVIELDDVAHLACDQMSDAFAHGGNGIDDMMRSRSLLQAMSKANGRRSKERSAVVLTSPQSRNHSLRLSFWPARVFFM
ncbi:hypothetical protein [Pararhizobium antarcticum]|uniref:Uncharacterized protein n=1 Tax=Pararhizobium antarcticum TaxID=1798805 RepID=A0A657LM38_9HYPH|nr:hypothetical protein [Pararhizobium antarcticum]OJF90750.1 hypothetical protein AX760_23940 [Pararhizobium antarcticum]OJF99447.1 hypothetical protein AX761_10675 [Rhizobium sp. 58]